MDERERAVGLRRRRHAPQHVEPRAALEGGRHAAAAAALIVVVLRRVELPRVRVDGGEQPLELRAAEDGRQPAVLPVELARHRGAQPAERPQRARGVGRGAPPAAAPREAERHADPRPAERVVADDLPRVLARRLSHRVEGIAYAEVGCDTIHAVVVLACDGDEDIAIVHARRLRLAAHFLDRPADLTANVGRDAPVHGREAPRIDRVLLVFAVVGVAAKQLDLGKIAILVLPILVLTILLLLARSLLVDHHVPPRRRPGEALRAPQQRLRLVDPAALERASEEEQRQPHGLVLPDAQRGGRHAAVDVRLVPPTRAHQLARAAARAAALGRAEGLAVDERLGRAAESGAAVRAAAAAWPRIERLDRGERPLR